MRSRARTEANFDDVPIPALLRAAQRTYSDAVARAQGDIGCDDLPASGSYIISAMNWSGASLEAVLRWMGVSKQAVSQAVDTLVERGYLQRARDPADRRRINLVLTDRGRAAGAAAKSAIERVDRRLLSGVGTRRISDTRETLSALIRLGRNNL